MEVENILPYDILVHLLSFLEHVEDVVAFSGVCWDWNDAAQDNDWWRRLCEREGLSLAKVSPTTASNKQQQSSPQEYMDCYDGDSSHSFLYSSSVSEPHGAWRRQYVEALTSTCMVWGRIGGQISTSRKPQVVSKLSGKMVKQVACGNGHCCAVTYRGEVFAWGEGSCGQIGNGRLGIFPSPVKVHFYENVTLPTNRDNTYDPMVGLNAARGREQVFDEVRLDDREAEYDDGNRFWEWSEDESESDTDSATEAQEQIPVHDIVFVRCGAEYSVALTATGKAFGWGSNFHHQLGLPNAQEIATPTRICEEWTLSYISCGEALSHAVTDSGLVLKWGYNPSSWRQYPSPTPVEGIPTPVTIVESRGPQTVALTVSGDVYLWQEDDQTVARILQDIHVSQIACAFDFFVGVGSSRSKDGDGGGDDCGSCEDRLFQMDTLSHFQWLDVVGGKHQTKTSVSTFKAVHCGGEHGCAVTDCGRIVTWGGGHAGQLGCGDFDTSDESDSDEWQEDPVLNRFLERFSVNSAAAGAWSTACICSWRVPTKGQEGKRRRRRRRKSSNQSKSPKGTVL